jgi:hypothetical protein
MISKINDSISANSRSVVVNGGGTPDAFGYKSLLGLPTDLTGFIPQVIGNAASFANGSGTLVGTSGDLLFDSREFGGSLSEVLIVNRSASVPAYVYINETGINTSAQAVLNPGESKHYRTGPIRFVYAAGVGTNSFVQVEGTNIVNVNAI